MAEPPTQPEQLLRIEQNRSSEIRRLANEDGEFTNKKKKERRDTKRRGRNKERHVCAIDSRDRSGDKSSNERHVRRGGQRDENASTVRTQ